MSPTQRTLALLRRTGYEAVIVERWNQFAKVRQDLLGCIDVLGFASSSVVGIQATTSGNQAKRVAKILAEPRAKVFVESGCRLYVHGWSKRKIKRGGKAYRFDVNEIEITLEQFA